MQKQNNSPCFNGARAAVIQNRGFLSLIRLSSAADAFAAEHVLRTFRDAIPELEKRLFTQSAAALASSTFLDDAWSELPDEWADIGNEVLPLSRIKSTINEGASK